ncbi:hypothetical protein A11A3_15602 [Alcanivorax hongdengensis A-11-3]|uniref:DUF2489 domain-containing protein n=2 Tax=Alcanivorax hongdengensis TaxID=519051 RepID=L0WBE0_9GAMM|nr:hypothetical protein A11A3_15602 [Alcanivorax hongdengensis A-11-3]
MLGWWLVKRHERQRLATQRGEQLGAILDSLEVLCRALAQEQVESSEAVIRMSVLLDSLPDTIAPKVDLAAIHQLAEQCQQFDRGDVRKSLTPRQRHRQDQQRWTLEDEQKEVVLQATQRLAEVIPSWRSGLGLSR